MPDKDNNPIPQTNLILTCTRPKAYSNVSNESLFLVIFAFKKCKKIYIFP